MRKIEVKSMSVKNFKGCKSLDISFSNVTNIYGRNASGKTTVADAFSWLLFGKDSQGREKFQIRPLDEKNMLIDKTAIYVKAILAVDGKTVKLEKAQEQNWVKKRGSEAEELAGNINKYAIDSFPISEKEYKEKIAEIIPENLFKLITDPKVFPTLPWKKQREILLQMVSGVTEEDLLNQEPDTYACIADDLRRAPVEKCMEKVKKQLAPLEKAREEIPIRIDEARKSLVEVENLSDLELQKNALEDELEKIRQEAMTGGTNVFQALQEERLNVVKKAEKRRDQLEDDLREKRAAARKEYDEATDRGRVLRAEYDQRKKEKRILEEEVKNRNQERKSLGEAYNALKITELPEESEFCDKCGQRLPAEKLEEIKANFEKQKASKMERIYEHAKVLKAEGVESSQKIAGLDEVIKDAKTAWETAVGESSKAYAILQELPDSADVSKDPTYMDLLKKAAEIKDKILSMSDSRKAQEELRKREQKVQQELDKVKELLAQAKASVQTEERIAKLEAELKEKAQQAGDLMQKQFLLEKISRKKMDMLAESINAEFSFVKFKLFEQQINGGVKDTCEMLVNGVPYSSLNSAAKMQAGLDVIHSLSRLHQISAPVWLDNRESVTDIPPVDAQVINLIVSPKDEKLRIE